MPSIETSVVHECMNDKRHAKEPRTKVVHERTNNEWLAKNGNNNNDNSTKGVSSSDEANDHRYYFLYSYINTNSPHIIIQYATAAKNLGVDNFRLEFWVKI